MKRHQVNSHTKSIDITGEETSAKLLRAKRLEDKRRIHKIRGDMDRGYADIEDKLQEKEKYE